MIDNERFKQEVYRKYNTIKNNPNVKDKFYITPINKKNELGLVKKIAIFVIVVLLMSGAIYAIVERTSKPKLNPSFTYENSINENNVWVGSFQIAWNNLINVIGQGKIAFESETSQLANELNNGSFTQNMINDNDYYIYVGSVTENLKDKIKKEVGDKFGKQNYEVLNEINFESINDDRSLIIYSVINKKFTFKKQLDRLPSKKFKDSKDYIKYFGINSASSEKLNEVVQVLFYNNREEFAIKLFTNENEEVILYRVNDNSSFSQMYGDLVEKTENYKGKKTFAEADELEIPVIDVDTIVNYDELCGKTIQGTKGMYIQSALQNVKFSLNEKGGNLISEAGIKGQYLSTQLDSRQFYFNNNFVLFLKEEGAQLPYFALTVNNAELLVSDK